MQTTRAPAAFTAAHVTEMSACSRPQASFELTRGYKPLLEGSYGEYKHYIENALPAESPVLFGLHTNAEIGLLISVCDTLFEAIFTLQGGGSGGDASDGPGQSKEGVVKELLADFQSRLPDEFVMMDIKAKIQEKTPYVVCVLQVSSTALRICAACFTMQNRGCALPPPVPDGEFALLAFLPCLRRLLVLHACVLRHAGTRAHERGARPDAARDGRA